MDTTHTLALLLNNILCYLDPSSMPEDPEMDATILQAKNVIALFGHDGVTKQVLSAPSVCTTYLRA